MPTRRSFLSLLPLTFLLGKAFASREAVEEQSPSQVAQRMFEQVRSKSPEFFVEGATPEILAHQRQAFDRLWQIALQTNRQQELLGKLGTDKATLEAAGDREYVLLWMRLIMQPLAELRDMLQNATLQPVAEIRESDKRWLVAYRLEGEELFPQMRPSVLQLVFERSGWQAGFCEQPGTIMVAAAAARQLPRLKITVLGEIPEEHLQHFVCRAEARFASGESVAPVFCCSWPQASEEVAQMRAAEYGGLKQRLRKEILGGVRGALAQLPAERS